MPADLQSTDSSLSAFITSWGVAAGTLSDRGADVLHMQLTKKGDNYEAVTNEVARGFNYPIDGVMIGNHYYVLEWGEEWRSGKSPLGSEHGLVRSLSFSLGPWTIHIRACFQDSKFCHETLFYTTPRGVAVGMNILGVPPRPRRESSCSNSQGIICQRRRNARLVSARPNNSYRVEKRSQLMGRLRFLRCGWGWQAGGRDDPAPTACDAQVWQGGMTPPLRRVTCRCGAWQGGMTPPLPALSRADSGSVNIGTSCDTIASAPLTSPPLACGTVLEYLCLPIRTTLTQRSHRIPRERRQNPGRTEIWAVLPSAYPTRTTARIPRGIRRARTRTYSGDAHARRPEGYKASYPRCEKENGTRG